MFGCFIYVSFLFIVGLCNFWSRGYILFYVCFVFLFYVYFFSIVCYYVECVLGYFFNIGGIKNNKKIGIIELEEIVR